MYSVDGVPLENPWLGWSLSGPTRPLSDLVVQRPSVRVPGRPGVLKGVPATVDAPTPTFVVQTPRKNADALVALWMQGATLSITNSADGRVVDYELLSTTYTRKVGPADEVIDIAFVVRLPDVCWRDKDITTVSPVVVNAPTVGVDLWPTSAEVGDGVIRIRGPVTGGLTIRSGRSWLTYSAAIPAGTYIRFELATRRAFATTSDVWEGGVEVTGSLRADGPGKRFVITPRMIDVLRRVGRIEVTTGGGRTAATAVDARGRGAYYIV